MQWLTGTPNFDFMKYRRVALVASSVASIVSVVAILFHGLALGIDFTGGALVEANYTSEANLGDIRTDLEAAGLEVAQVQTFGSTSDVLIRLRPTGDVVDATALQNQLLEILRVRSPDVTLQPATTIGAQVGTDLAEQGALAMLMALIMIF